MASLNVNQIAQIQSNISNGGFNPPNASALDDPNFYYQPNVPQPADRITAGYMSYDNLSFPSDKPKYHMNLNLAAYKRTSINAIGSLNFYSTIRLPLPMQLVDAHGVSWDAKQLGWAGALVAQGVGELSQGNIGTGAAEIAGGVGVTALGAMAGGVAAAAPGVLGGIARQAVHTAQNSAAGVSAVTGVAPNRFLTVVFEGPQYKEYEFRWRLTPRTPTESEVLRRIVKKINNAMSPSINQRVFNGAGSILWNYPDIIVPSFVPNPKYLYKFKPSVIRNFVANYSPAGVPAFFHDKDDGLSAPEGIDISMRCMELEFWLGSPTSGADGDFTDSNDSGDVYGGSSGNVTDGNGGSIGLNSRNLGTGEVATNDAAQAQGNVDAGAAGI